MIHDKNKTFHYCFGATTLKAAIGHAIITKGGRCSVDVFGQTLIR